MSIKDMRQGREISPRRVIADLKRIAVVGVVNARNDLETIRQAAVLLEAYSTHKAGARATVVYGDDMPFRED